MTERAQLLIGALVAVIALPILMVASAVINAIAANKTACEFGMLVILAGLAASTLWLCFNLDGDR